MCEESEKITLPKELQQQMIKFFLKTSIPRKKQAENKLLSEKTTDGSDKSLFNISSKGEI